MESTKQKIATLNSLAAQITDLAAKMTKQLEADQVPPVTLEANSPIKYARLPGDVFLTRQLLDDALKDLWILSQGPSESVFNYVHMAIPDAACLNILNQFDFWNAVPIDGEASYEDVAVYTNLPVEVVSRVLDHAVTMRFFTKASPTALAVKHTSRSAALAKDAGLSAFVQTVLDETGPPMFLLPEALRRFSRGKADITKDMRETAFKLCYSGGAWGDYENSWDFIENDGDGEQKGWRQRNFVKFMAYIKDLFDTEGIVLDAIDWKAAGDITVVDIGGSAGHDAAALATTYPNLRITIQDLPAVAPVFTRTFPPHLRPRVSFHTHNMFDPQPVSADVYLLKWILHDWPDAESISILQALRPALKPGARVVFIDYVGKQGWSEEELELPRSVRGFGTATDLRMMALFNARERPVEAWKEVFRRADERFEVVGVRADKLSFMCVLEAVWRG